jgi:hypothetical protein
MPDKPEVEEVWRDPIVAEVRRVREALFAATGYDIRAFCRRLRAEQDLSGHPVVTRPSRSNSKPTDRAA